MFLKDDMRDDVHAAVDPISHMLKIRVSLRQPYTMGGIISHAPNLPVSMPS